jgi:hypothetical protein
MRIPMLFLLPMVAIGTLPAQTQNFDAVGAGILPTGWTAAMTHKGGAPQWQILKDESAPSRPNVLAQTSDDRTSGRFPLAIWEGATFQDGGVTVKFKPVAGSGDQAAGIVWRYSDPDNYYIVRANALEDNVVLYKVEGGNRVSLAPKGTATRTYGVKQAVPKQTWSTLRVAFIGNRFEVFFDGRKIMEVEDNSFLRPGKVGLWTKADSVIYFDDFHADRK